LNRNTYNYSDSQLKSAAPDFLAVVKAKKAEFAEELMRKINSYLTCCFALFLCL
jgi:hypothetical protein